MIFLFWRDKDYILNSDGQVKKQHLKMFSLDCQISRNMEKRSMVPGILALRLKMVQQVGAQLHKHEDQL